LRDGGALATGSFAEWLGAAGIVSSQVALVLAVALVDTLILGSYILTNDDGSMDIFIPHESILEIPIAIADPQPISVLIKVKDTWIALLL
jgi:hypothetical protein